MGEAEEVIKRREQTLVSRMNNETHDELEPYIEEIQHSARLTIEALREKDWPQWIGDISPIGDRLAQWQIYTPDADQAKVYYLQSDGNVILEYADSIEPFEQELVDVDEAQKILGHLELIRLRAAKWPDR